METVNTNSAENSEVSGTPEGTKIRVTIDCNTWHRGMGAIGSKLMRKDNKNMCCLGFVALECGLQKEEIIDKADPDEAYCDTIHKNNTFFKLFMRQVYTESIENNTICGKIMMINDDIITTDQEKIAELKELFPQVGIEPVFINYKERSDLEDSTTSR